MKVDTRKFNAALRLALEHTSRELPDVINKAAVDVIIKAASMTKKADPSEIERSLTNGVITITGRKRKDGAASIKNVFDPKPMVYLIINAKRRAKGLPGLNNRDMSKAAQAFIRRRKAAVGFVAFAGWQKALIAMGGRGFGSSKSKMTGLENTSARRGGGSKAAVGKLAAKFFNTATACEQYGAVPLQMALDAKSDDMRRHVEEKLSKICREASR
jgi:hypothetical protein